MEGDQLPSGNNNLLLSETIKLIEQMKVGDIGVIECGIEIGYRERMHHSQAGMFDTPHLDHRKLRRLHGMAFGIPRIDDDVHKREPIPGKLFNGLQTQAGRPP